ncbi:hypothetical protein AVEN_96883-1 [Araneus ventricosus]|uniref:DUF5641 domain-containing protein n=1 Tax=Araneus ventricosus TaxID=182803 RepID=A0A4Y2IQX9_ARAVE|nr:hypothetical protein AVEN_96883-1 [Araneus ventricosus]
MTTVFAYCESAINSRTLTHLCEDETMKPISPSMFLRDLHECSISDIDQVEQTYLRKGLKHKESLLKGLKNRFRSEYLGALIQRRSKTQLSRTTAVGDIVPVDANNSKRINWSLVCITEAIPGKDSCARLVKVRTKHQELLRLIQKIFPLEIATAECPKLMKHRELTQSLDPCTENSGPISTNEQRVSSESRRINTPERLDL